MADEPTNIDPKKFSPNLVKALDEVCSVWDAKGFDGVYYYLTDKLQYIKDRAADKSNTEEQKQYFNRFISEYSKMYQYNLDRVQEPDFSGAIQALKSHLKELKSKEHSIVSTMAEAQDVNNFGHDMNHDEAALEKGFRVGLNNEDAYLKIFVPSNSSKPEKDPVRNAQRLITLILVEENCVKTVFDREASLPKKTSISPEVQEQIRNVMENGGKASASRKPTDIIQNSELTTSKKETELSH